MKKILLGLLVVALLVPSVDARRKTPKAGKIDDGVFTDTKYGYSLNLSDDWDPRVRKDKEEFRLTMIKRNYGIPTHYLNAEDYTYAPRIVLFVGETNLSASQLIDSLVSYDYGSDMKNEMRKEFDFLNEQEIIPQGRKPFQIGDLQAYQWVGEAKYMKAVQTSASSAGGKRVNSSYGGSLIAVKKPGTDTVLVIHIMCENEFFDNVFAQAMQMISTLKWGDGKE